VGATACVPLNQKEEWHPTPGKKIICFLPNQYLLRDVPKSGLPANSTG